MLDKYLLSPFPNSEKISISGKIFPELKVKMRRVTLSSVEDPTIHLYDTSGPYTDENVQIELIKGLRAERLKWIKERNDVVVSEHPFSLDGIDISLEEISPFFKARKPLKAKHNKGVTQMHYAKNGIITPEMEYVAIRENLGKDYRTKDNYGKNYPYRVITPEFVRQQLAEGEAIIPCNINHAECEPMIIGKNFLVKTNAKVGNAFPPTSLQHQLEKVIWCYRWGVDTITEVAINGNIHAGREWIIRNSAAPVGSLPLYQTLKLVDGKIEELTWDIYKKVLIKQAEQGVDYFILHPGLLKKYINHLKPKKASLASTGGRIMAKWCIAHNKENFIYSKFNEICEIANAYDVSLFLGKGLRDNFFSENSEDMQGLELKTLGDLTKMARLYDCQVIVEGPTNTFIDQIENRNNQHFKLCNNAPIYTLTPLVTDFARGYDYINGSIGSALMGWHGTAMLCQRTSLSYSGGQGNNIKSGIISCKIAAHAADLAKDHPAAKKREKAISRARADKRLQDQINLSLDPEAAHIFDELSTQEINSLFQENIEGEKALLDIDKIVT